MKSKFEEPLNSSERYMYAMCVRLDALCNMLSSFLEVYAEKNAVATTSNEETLSIVSVAEEVPVKKTRKKKE